MITPRTLQGFSDFLPEEMILRQYLIEIWKHIFEKYGYGPLETPVLEYADILLGKYGEEEKLIYHFKDQGDRHVAMRYDQTVPLARAVAQHFDKINFPFKRYEINRVWRAEAARRGRKREFYQCDIDILGTNSLKAEAEICAILQEGLKALNLPPYRIQISHRKLLEGLLNLMKMPEQKRIEVSRSIDKLDKIGLNGVEDELKSRGVENKFIPRVLEFISIEADSNEEILNKIEKLVEGDPSGIIGIEELKQLLAFLKIYQIPEDKIKITPGFIRGLDYYTGTIIEVIIPEFGVSAVAGGGRYDNLCGLYTKENISGVGVAVGLERLYVLMKEKNLFPKNLNLSEVLVTVFSPETYENSVKIAEILRENGIKTTLYFDDDKLKKQFKYADTLNIPYVVIIGPDEAQKGIFVLKNMLTGEQSELKEQELVDVLKKSNT